MASRVTGGASVDNTDMCAAVTFSHMPIVPAGAPMSGAIASPTSLAIVHHRSAHARTPRVAQVAAYSRNDASTPRGIAPSELEIM